MMVPVSSRMGETVMGDFRGRRPFFGLAHGFEMVDLLAFPEARKEFALLHLDAVRAG